MQDIYLSALLAMELILVGNPEISAHARSNLYYLSCITNPTQPPFLFMKTIEKVIRIFIVFIYLSVIKTKMHICLKLQLKKRSKQYIILLTN